MFNYDFDHRKTLIALLPPFLRKSRLVAFLYALIFPLVAIYSSLLAKRDDYRLQVKRNSQQMILQRQLNSLFDPVLQRFIVFTPDQDRLRLNAYKQTENQTKTAAYMQSEGQARTNAYAQADIRYHEYTVQGSTFVQGREAEIKDYLDKYTIASKRYNLIWI